MRLAPQEAALAYRILSRHRVWLPERNLVF